MQFDNSMMTAVGVVHYKMKANSWGKPFLSFIKSSEADLLSFISSTLFLNVAEL